MRPWQTQLVTALAGLVLASGSVAVYNHQQREIGRRDVLLAQSRAEGRAATRRADSLAAIYRVDTVRLTRLKLRTDTMTVTVDLWKTDTLRVVEYVTRADSTVRACTAALQTCEARVGAERARAEAAQADAKLLKASMPGPLTPWRQRAVGALAGAALFALVQQVK